MNNGNLKQDVYLHLREAEAYVSRNQLQDAFTTYKICLDLLEAAEVDIPSNDSSLPFTGNLEVMFLKAVVLNSKAVAMVKGQDANDALNTFKASYFLKKEIIAIGTDTALNGTPEGNIAKGYAECCNLVGPLYNMGRVYHANKVYKEAEKFYNNAYRKLKKTGQKNGKYQFGEDSSEDEFMRIPICLQMGIVNCDMKRYEKAKTYLLEALECGERSMGENDLGRANLLTHVGKVHFHLGEYNEALKKYEEAKDICFKTGMSGNILYVLKQLITITNDALMRQSSSIIKPKNKSIGPEEVANIEMMITILRDTYMDESSRWISLLVTESVSSQCKEILRMQAACCKKFADDIVKVNSVKPKGQMMIALAKALHSFFDERYVINESCTRGLKDQSVVWSFGVQTDMFKRLRSALEFFIDPIENIGRLVNVLANTYHDYEKIINSPSHQYNSSNVGVVRVVRELSGSLKSITRRFKDVHIFELHSIKAKQSSDKSSVNNMFHQIPAPEERTAVSMPSRRSERSPVSIQSRFSQQKRVQPPPQSDHVSITRSLHSQQGYMTKSNSPQATTSVSQTPPSHTSEELLRNLSNVSPTEKSSRPYDQGVDSYADNGYSITE